MNCRPLPVARFLLAGLLILLGGSAHADEMLTYDANGNIVTRTLPGGTTTYQYDDLDRLTAEAGPARTQNLSYDPNGNRTSDATGTHTYTVNTDRQLTIAGQSVSLDAAGYITQARNLGFVWNAAGQLAEVRQGSPTGTLLASYTYDYQGRRTRKVISGSGSLTYRTTIYTYDQYDRLSGEFDGAGGPRRTYVWRDALPLAVIDHYGTYDVAYYLETDHLGSPISARDKDGTVVWRWASDAFGATLPNEDADGNVSTVTINLRFPGQYYDKESGLHYNYHRYYDPKIGRYMSSDPIGIAGGVNTFTYVGGNPLGLTDPLGLYHYNAPPPRTVPVQEPTANALRCLEACLQRNSNNPNLDLLITGGAETSGHSRNSRHYRGEACDVAGPRANPIRHADVMECAARCGFGGGQFESFPDNRNRDHWHLQLNPGNGVPAVQPPSWE